MIITMSTQYDLDEMVKVQVSDGVIEAKITDICVLVRKKGASIIYHTDVVGIETVPEEHIIGRGTPREKRKVKLAGEPF